MPKFGGGTQGEIFCIHCVSEIGTVFICCSHLRLCPNQHLYPNQVSISFPWNHHVAIFFDFGVHVPNDLKSDRIDFSNYAERLPFFETNWNHSNCIAWRFSDHVVFKCVLARLSFQLGYVFHIFCRDKSNGNSSKANAKTKIPLLGWCNPTWMITQRLDELCDLILAMTGIETQNLCNDFLTLLNHDSPNEILSQSSQTRNLGQEIWASLLPVCCLEGDVLQASRRLRPNSPSCLNLNFEKPST